MDKEQLLARIEKAWRVLQESYAGLSDSELMEPGVAGGWSVRDVIAHVTTWEEETLKHLPGILKGIRPPRYSAAYGGIDTFNALMTERKSNLSLSEVRRQADATHRRLVDFVESAPEELGTVPRFLRRLRLDTYGHYRHHTEAIRHWRERRSPRP